jgi:hypothetical protein
LIVRITQRTQRTRPVLMLDPSRGLPGPLDRGDGRRRNLARALVVVACAGAACGTAYQPRPSARIGVIIHHGVALYVKNGQEVPIGALGGALEPLVASSPAAAARAHRAFNQLAVGVPLYVLGAAAVIVGLSSSTFPLRWTAIGAGTASLGTGLSLIGAGFTNAVDAVNIYNDSVAGPAPTLP